jgi:uncharacterized protein
MAASDGFLPGRSIVLREICFGKIWEARPALVMIDRPDFTAFFLPPVSFWKDSSEDLRPAERFGKTWQLKDSVWGFGGYLRLHVTGTKYSVLLLRNADGSLYEWYINLEEPLRYTASCYDYEDNVLDIGVTPDLSSWIWKDEDELEEMVELGLYSKEKASSLYNEGEKAVNWLLSGKSPYNEWIGWLPDPSWGMPILPEGWDSI